MISYSEELSHAKNTSNVAICAKIEYKPGLCYGVDAVSMHTATRLPILKLVSLSSARHIFPHDRPAPSSACICLIYAQQPNNYSVCKEQYSSASVLMTYSLEYGFAIVYSLAINIPLSTLFSVRFIRGIFPAETKVVLWHFNPEAILSTTQQNQTTRTGTSTIAATLRKHSIGDEASPHHIARQIVLKPYSEHSVLVTTTASSSNTFQSWYSE